MCCGWAFRNTKWFDPNAVDVPDGEAVGAIAASAGVLRLTAGRWRWLTHGDEVRLPEGPDGRLVTGPGWVTVRWAGTNPLFECPWLDSEVPIGDLTRDLRARARDMERAKYPC